MDNKNLPEEENSIIVLTDENGNEFSFEYLDCIEHEGKEYIYLLPAEDESTDVIILEVEPVDEDKEDYIVIEDEDELVMAFGLFKEKYKDVLTFGE